MPAGIASHVFRQRLDLFANLAHGGHGFLGFIERLWAAVSHELLLCFGLQFLDLDDAGIGREADIAEQPGDQERQEGHGEQDEQPANGLSCRRSLVIEL